MADKQVGVCLLGCGIVGGGVVSILTQQREMLRRRTGLDFVLRHVVVKGPEDFPPNAAELPMRTDAAAAIADPVSEIVIELIGGTGAANTFIEQALKLGKPVVTANKALLAKRGADLFALARAHGTCIAFEASAGGGIPIVDALCRGLIANRIDALLGIVNGTCNFILTQMTQKGWSYQQALKEAQAQGFAEANPAMDVQGRDAAHKLAILAGLAFNARITDEDIPVTGIDGLEVQDIGYARELGYVIKLLAIAQRWPGNRVSLRVHPTLVHRDQMLADVGGSFNAISVYGHALGHGLWYGRGAGRMPSASAVVADLVSVALGTQQQLFAKLRVFHDQVDPPSLLPWDDLESRFYLRLSARDEPGVLAQVAAILARRRISVWAINQHEGGPDQHVPIVITTHVARQGDMRAAVAELDALPTVNHPAVCLHIIDSPTEFATY